MYVGIGQLVDAVEESEYLAIILKETDDRLVKSGKFLIRLIAPRIVGASTIEDITSTIARLVFRDSLSIRETEDAHH